MMGGSRGYFRMQTFDTHTDTNRFTIDAEKPTIAALEDDERSRHAAAWVCRAPSGGGCDVA